MGKKQKRKRTVGLSKSSPRAGGSTIAAIKGVEPAFTLEGRTGKRVGAENDVVSGAVSMEELGSIRCKHVESGVNLEKLRTQLARGGLVSQCHDCSQVVLPTGRDKAGRAKVVKRKGPGPSAGDGSGGQKLWICLACGFINCGGSLLSTQTSQQSGDGEEIVKMETVTMQYMGLSHAKQHSRQREPSHPLAMEWGEDLACWCFVCDVEVDYNSEPSALNLESEGQDMASSKLKLLQQAAKLVQDKLQETKSLKIDAATTTNDNQGSESKVDEPAKVSSGNSIEAEVKPVKERCVIKGLMNLGNTCFFNSVMQNLLGVDMLWEHFSVGGSVQEGPLTTALRKFFQEIDPKSDESSDFRIHDEGASSSFRRTTRARSFSSNIGNTYTPRDLFGAICMKAPRFKGFQQQDSHELLRCLLDGLHTEEETMWKVTKPGRNGEVIEWAMDVEPDVLRSERGGSSKLQGVKTEDGEGESMKKKQETFVEKIFGGQLSSTVRCCLCGHSSVVYEPFLDLSLPIPSKQPNKKSGVRKDQARVSSVLQSQRLQALGKGAKGLEPLDQPKTSTMSADANSWGSGETDQASQSVTQGVICLPYDSSFRNGSSPYGQDDGNNDVSSLKPENLSSKEGARSSLAEDQAAQTILPPVMCLPYVATDSSRSSTLVEDLDKEFAWMDYTEDIVETSSPVPTGIIVHGGSSVATDKLLTAVPEAQQSADKGQQTLDAGKECSMVVKCLSSGHQTFGNFEDIGYLTGAPYGSAEEPCGMDEIDGSASVGDPVFFGPSPCPTSEATDVWTRADEGEGQQQQKFEMLTSESLPLLLEKSNDTLPAVAGEGPNLAADTCKQKEGSLTSMQLHLKAAGSEIGKNSHGESVLATNVASEKDHTDFDGVADLFEDSYVEEKEDGRQAERARQESSSSLIQMDGFSSVSDSRNTGSTRVKRDEFYFAGNGGVLGLKEDNEREEDASFPMSLEGCLLAFTKPELLSGENAWGCENCSHQLQERKEAASSLKSLHIPELESKRQDAKSGSQLQASGNTLAKGIGAGVTKTSEVLDGKNSEMQIQTEELPKVEVSSGSIGGTELFETSNSLEDALNGMNLVPVDLVENRTHGKGNDHTSRKSWKGEATSCLNTNEVVPCGEKDVKVGVRKLKANGDQERHLGKAAVNDWEDLADLNVPSTSSAGLMYVEGGKPSVCQLLTDSHYPAENGENNALRNGGTDEMVQDSEMKIGPLRSGSQVTGGAVADGYTLFSEDGRSKVGDTVEPAVKQKQVQPNQMQQTGNDGDFYIPVKMGLASTSNLELRKNNNDHVGEADVEPKLPSLSSGSLEVNSNGFVQVSTIKAENFSGTDQSRKMNLRPRSGLSALAGDLSALHDGHAKLQKAGRLKSQKAVEDPPKKVIVKRDAEKRFLINKAPPVLTVHLKRFAQDMRGRLSKLSGHVTFHEWLDISPFIDQRWVCFSVLLDSCGFS